MPARKVTPAAFSKMEAKVEALESEISIVRSTLTDVHNAVKQNHASLLAMLEKCLGKTTMEGEGSASLSVKLSANLDRISSEKKKGEGSSMNEL
ncbi:hypothetical protein A2U01_0054023, partial [Trifolium medium]|nr:hypothetical protein [Trifolium medium]